MKTINVLPRINSMEISGRIIAEPKYNNNKTACYIRIIHNFGGEKDDLVLNMVMFKGKNGFPEDTLKKGASVLIKARMESNNFTDENGKKSYRTQYVISDIKGLESANNIEFAGRLVADASLNDAKTRATFKVIRNFGGDREPLALQFVMFKPKNKNIDTSLLKKGTPVVVKAYIQTNYLKDKDGNIVNWNNELIVKSVKKAELVPIEVEDNAPEADAEE